MLFPTQLVIQFKVNNLARRLITILVALAACALLLCAALVSFAVGVLTDPRVNASRELLEAGIGLVPNSAALNSRLAEAEMSQDDRDILTVERRAHQAVNLSPWDYRNRLLLATVKEASGDRGAAEQSVREALALAPNYVEVHWRLANLLLREGKLAKSVVEFRLANSSNAALLPGTLDLLWRVSAGNLATVQAVTPRDPKSQLVLAEFLLKQSRASDAITVFSGIDRNSLVSLSEVSAFISTLISEGRLEEGRGLWVGLVSGTYAQPGHPLPGIWNGSFESDISKNLAQFDWNLSRNDYAVPTIDSAVARSGSRSLRVDFTGRDTTRLDGQVKQTIVVRPGGTYRLQYSVKTEHLVTPEGPRVVVTDAAGTEFVRSDPVAAGSNDWHAVTIEFTVPTGAQALVIAIKRVPRFSYDAPTSGTVWFDDFVLSEESK